MAIKVTNKRLSIFIGHTGKFSRKGIVIHNTAGASSAQAEYNRLAGCNITQLQNGIAHYYVDEKDCLELVDPAQAAWHTANTEGNSYYVGIEACKSFGSTDAAFKAIEERCFELGAILLKKYGLKANRNTVRLHKEFSATACPHRSWDLHGQSINAVKDYFIAGINKYMGSGSTTSNTASTTAKYFTSLPGTKMIVVTKEDYSRKANAQNGDAWGKTSNCVKKMTKGTLVEVKGIKKSTSGVPRFILTDGTLFTANKSYVAESDYYGPSFNGKLFELLSDQEVYSKPSFVADNKRKVKLAKGTRVYIRAFEKQGSVYRARTAVDYITANKKYIKPV